MIDETVTPIDRFDAPYGKTIELLNVVYPGGMTLLRVRIREGRRFTIMDIDADTVRRWAGAMDKWAERQGGR